MNRVLENRIVVVTGANGALGRVVRRRVEEAGATPVGIDLKADAGGEVVGADLADAGAAAKAFAGILSRWDRVDALLNVAGGFRMAPAVELEPWETLWRMNVATALHSIRAVLPVMVARGEGAIVSIAARVEPAGAQMAAYAASKDHGVRVNCVMPSILDTEANRRAMPDADFGRWVTLEALADVLVFLCSDQARAITGAAIPVSGRI